MDAPFALGHLPLPRARLVPPATVIAGSLIVAALPVVANAPVLPPCGLLMALAWRLLRPELWPTWVALPLGLTDDLLTGQPLGSGMASWTLVFLALDRIDHRFGTRDHWFDWSIAALAIIVVLTAGILAAGAPVISVMTILPQIAITVFCFPAVARLAAALDRARLRR